MKAFRPLPLCLLCTALLAGPASAASLREALDQAWAQQAEQFNARDAQFAAQESASRAWTPEPPRIGLFNSSDRLNRNEGYREWEVELAAPIWLPGQREQAQNVARAEKSAFAGRTLASRWQLAGQLREGWWAVRLAEVDAALARRQLDEAEQLAADVHQRVRSGDLAPLDENQADGRVQQARQELSLARLALRQARQNFALISGDAALPDRPETLAEPEALERHPLLRSLQEAALSAQARLEQATVARRDAPELALGYSSERDERAAPYSDRIKLGISIPFGSEARNRPRISAANADWIEAQTQRELETRRIRSEIANARLELEQSREQLRLADDQLRLAEQRAAWIAQGFRLGQFDLSTQIRSQQERLAAAAQAERARHAEARAISRFNQAAGVLP